MKILGYCVLNNKEYVMFKDKHCADGELKLTDGFKDKLIRSSLKVEIAQKEQVDLEKIVRRMRGARPWHSLLPLLREDVKTE